MIKPKAPKNMTAVEFVAHLEIIASREMLAKNLEGWAITLQGLRKELSEPAPNPFKPDQLAWMRMSQKQFGFSYASMFGETVYLFNGNPMNLVPQKWKEYSMCSVYSQCCFLRDFLPKDGSDCICFADYAPLEEK